MRSESSRRSCSQCGGWRRSRDTWADLVRALREIELGALAKEIEDNLCTSRCSRRNQDMTDERAQQLIDEAMELGSLQQRNVVGVITGLMGAGKTTLLYHLFGLAPPDLYTSTGVAEQSIRGFLHHILRLSAGVWQRLSYKDIREFLAPLIQAGMRKSDVDKLASALMRDLDVQSAKPLDPSLQEETTPLVRTSPQLHEESPSCQKIVPLVTTATGPTPKSLPKDLILELVHMIDTGGQPELMEVMPSLIHNANLALVLVDLRYGLDKRPPVDCHEQGVCYKRQFQSQHTSKDVILKLASTLHAKKSQNKAFRLIIVATHRDCVKGDVATRIEALNHQLESLLLPTFEGQLILFQPPDKIPFVLDLKKPDRDDKEALELIRTKVGEPGLGSALDTPTSFFVFEQDLLKFAEKDAKCYILSFDECKLVGARLKMSSEMVEAALVLFHCQNTFLYFRHILPNHVFIKPQVPLDIVNGIVGFSYKVNAGEFKGFPAKFVSQLRQGIITEEMLSFDKISPHFQEGVYEVNQAFLPHFHYSTAGTREKGSPNCY
ncbi:hypothetical protein GBAR_LOCUS25766 [Geodia barretti]|uniref:Uncharacterized protein n=1 Tax=Geodia barretti TaxID=519541 RepID=A0AA35TEN4_GEOBA|nr:hypothetical protein GBAR_LOCUS25766 [Geodia barretti]